MGRPPVKYSKPPAARARPHGAPPAAAAQSTPERPRVTRKDFTDRLGLPADATNAEVIAAIDTVVASRKTADAAPAPTVDEFLSALAYGEHTNATKTMLDRPETPLSTDDQQLYDQAFYR